MASRLPNTIQHLHYLGAVASMSYPSSTFFSNHAFQFIEHLWAFMSCVVLRQIVFALLFVMMLQLQRLYLLINRSRGISIYAETWLISSSRYNWPKLRNGATKCPRPSSTTTATATLTTASKRNSISKRHNLNNSEESQQEPHIRTPCPFKH